MAISLTKQQVNKSRTMAGKIPSGNGQNGNLYFSPDGEQIIYLNDVLGIHDVERPVSRIIIA